MKVCPKQALKLQKVWVIYMLPPVVYFYMCVCVCNRQSGVFNFSTLKKGWAKEWKIPIWISKRFTIYKKQYSAKSSDLHTPWVCWCYLPNSHDLNLTFCTHPHCQTLLRWTHFKYPVRFLLFIQIHPGLADNSVLSRRFRRQVKLRPLQVETQTCSNGFDETLF